VQEKGRERDNKISILIPPEHISDLKRDLTHFKGGLQTILTINLMTETDHVTTQEGFGTEVFSDWSERMK